MASPASSSPSSSSPGSFTASPASSPANSPPGSPTLVAAQGVPGVPSHNPLPPSGAPNYHYSPPPYAAPIRSYDLAAPPQLPPPHPQARYAQISTPYDFLVSYEYFSEPKGFKPYHFRQCYMPTSGTYVIVEKAWSTQTDLDQYRQVLLRYHPGCFADVRYKCTADVPEGFHRPKAQVCPLFSSEMQRAIDRAVPAELEEADPKLFARLKHLARVEDQIVFFVVVQGKEDASASKLVVKGSFYQIMTEIFSAAANGYSVVFSGAMREKDVARLGKGAKNRWMKALGIEKRVECEWKYIRSDVRFKRVNNYDGLLEDDPDKNVIRVGC